MLGYFAVYGGQYSDTIRRQERRPEQGRRWWQLLMPHQIDALN